MSPRLAARTALLCTLVALATPAVAQRREVAVIDLTLGDPGANELAVALRAELGRHVALQQLASAQFEAALLGKPSEDDAQAIKSAQASLAEAERALVAFDSQTAAAQAETGMTTLLSVTPQVARPLYAALALHLGLAMLGQQKPVEANAAFALVHTLSPGRALDPARYLPEIVTAFNEAKPTGARGTLAISGTGEVWIDGESRGAAPRAFEVPLGRHVVQLTGVDRETRGVPVFDLSPGKELAISVPDAPAPNELQIRRARLALAQASDTIERASTMGKLAKLIRVGDAVLLSLKDGKLMVQTWRDRAPGFSKLEERGAHTSGELLLPLAPPPPIKVPPLEVIPLPLELPRWYRKREVQVVVAVGVLAAVLGAVLWARQGIEMQSVNTDVKAK